jgi:hypothetical protein
MEPSTAINCASASKNKSLTEDVQMWGGRVPSGNVEAWDISLMVRHLGSVSKCSRSVEMQ